MAKDYQVARSNFARYVYCRDTGHREFLAKANRCEDFYAGQQWEKATIAELRAAKRPALTINKILITLSSIYGEQIETRSEIQFKPRYGAPPQNAEVLTKLFKCIGDENMLDWVRSDVFVDGAITSRGYYDVRLRFDRNTAGDVEISRLNPRTVLPDPDASDYDPERWNDVIVTKWQTADDIYLIYGNKEAADALRLRGESVWEHGWDSIDTGNDRFGGSRYANVALTEDIRATMRGIRVIDRQHRVLSRMKYLIDPKSGDRMRVPDQWGRDEIAIACQKGGLIVSEEMGKRIRWTVTADDFVLHDDWSPYHRFTVVPYFPHFRYGRTVGLVEGLIDSQELLNKTTSQELHIINTMANSGWIVKSGSLMNMSIDELESQGAKTGLVLEVATTGAIKDSVEKIQPNQIPQGLDRLSFKAEQYIKSVSGRGDNQLGLTRPDQSGKLTEEANKASDVALRPALDNLERSDYLLARNILDLVQNFYTDYRVMHLTMSDLTGEQVPVEINVPDLASGEVLNDLSLGEYTVVVTSVKARRTLEESQFQQALGMREAGIMIPDRFLIENSNLVKKGDIIKAMDAQEQSPENQAMKKAQVLGHALEVANLKAEASRLDAEAAHKRAKTVETLASAQEKMRGEPGEQEQMQIEREKAEQDMALKDREHEQKMQIMREEAALKLQLQREEAAEKRRAMRIEQAAKAKMAVAQARTEHAKASAIEQHPKEAAPAAAGGGAPSGDGKPGAKPAARPSA